MLHQAESGVLAALHVPERCYIFSGCEVAKVVLLWRRQLLVLVTERGSYELASPTSALSNNFIESTRSAVF